MSHLEQVGYFGQCAFSSLPKKSHFSEGEILVALLSLLLKALKYKLWPLAAEHLLVVAFIQVLDPP